MSGINQSTDSVAGFKKRLALTVILLNLLVYFLTGLTLYQSRIMYEKQTTVATQNLASILVHFIDGEIDSIDLALIAVKNEAEGQAARGEIDKDALNRYIDKMHSYLPQLQGIRVTNSGGDVIYGTGTQAPGVTVNLADRDYFIFERDNPKGDIFISKPIIGRIAKQWVFTIARRVNNPDGSFAGIVYGSVTLDHLLEVFSGIDVGKKGSITLRNDQLAVIVRYPEPTGSGSTIGNIHVAKEYSDLIKAGRDNATFKARSGLDGTERLYSYRKINGYPLYIIVAMAKDEYLAAWRNESLIHLGLVAVFTLITLFSSRLLLIGWKREKKIESELRKSKEELELRVEQRTADLNVANEKLRTELAERERAEGDLKLKSFTLDNLSEEIIWTTPEGRIWNVNDVACKKLGYTREELLSLSVADIDPVLPKDEWQPHWEELKRAGSLQLVSLHKTKGGDAYPVEIIANYFNHNGLEYNCAIVRDITERMHDEEALRQSEKHYRELVENMLEGVAYCRMIFDENGHPADFIYLDVNRAFTRLTGLENVVGRNVAEVLPGIRESSPELLEIYGRVALTGRPETFETYFKPLSSWLSISVYSPEREYFVAVFDNITEHRNLEEQLRHSQKMEAVGQLAGGIAHDFNNALTAIIGFGTLAEMRMAKDDPLRKNMEQILAAADRAANLTRSLLAFSRKQSLNPQPVNLCEIVHHMEKFLVRLIGEDVHLHTDFREANLTVNADSGQIEQVLMNLAANSRDAMPAGGSLLIETSSVLIDEAFVHFHGYGEPGRYALMTVSDSGAGLDKETIKKIFEPFFTTKEIGKGTGLGLSIVYGIIKQHNGYINVYSEPGKGTTFNIYLPLIEAGSAPKEKELLPRPEGGTETVLVAEDDPFTRNVEVSILKEFGYTVIEAVDGEDAVKKFLEQKDAVQILLFDMIMPNKNGKEAYEEIKGIRPEVPVLFFSGYTADFIDKKRMLEEGIEVLIKPVHPHVLARKVRDVLDKRS